MTAQGTRVGQARGLFITFGSFSLSNNQLVRALERARPDVTFDQLDVSAELRRRPLRLLRVLGGAISEYGPGVLKGRNSLRYGVLRSCALFSAAQDLIAEKVRKNRYDFTIQTQSLFDAATPGIPNYVYTDHVATARVGQQGEGGSAGLRPTSAWLALERQIYSNAKHVFVCGTSIRNRLMREYDIAPDRVSAVGAGALAAQDPDTSLQRYATRRILFVGLEWERKGGPELLQAFRALRARMPDASLTVAGCSPPVEESGVEVLGRLPRHELDARFRDCACFCMPSRVEPFGIVYVEAMKHGRPVVACRVGDVADIVADGETGLLVPPGDVPALTDALEAVLCYPERSRRMGLAGQIRAARFDWDVIAELIAARLPSASALVPTSTQDRISSSSRNRGGS